jgi:hypothetical protein
MSPLPWALAMMAAPSNVQPARRKAKSREGMRISVSLKIKLALLFVRLQNSNDDILYHITHFVQQL